MVLLTAVCVCAGDITGLVDLLNCCVCAGDTTGLVDPMAAVCGCVLGMLLVWLTF